MALIVLTHQDPTSSALTLSAMSARPAVNNILEAKPWKHLATTNIIGFVAKQNSRVAAYAKPRPNSRGACLVDVRSATQPAIATLLLVKDLVALLFTYVHRGSL